MRLLFYLTVYIFTAGALGMPAQNANGEALDKGPPSELLEPAMLSALSSPGRRSVGSAHDPVALSKARAAGQNAAKRATPEEEDAELYIRRMGPVMQRTAREWIRKKEFLLITTVGDDKRMQLHISASEMRSRKSADAIANNGATSTPGASYARLYMFDLQYHLEEMFKNENMVDKFDWKGFYTLEKPQGPPEGQTRVFLGLEWQTRELQPVEEYAYMRQIEQYIYYAGAEVIHRENGNPRIGADPVALGEVHAKARSDFAQVDGSLFGQGQPPKP